MNSIIKFSCLLFVLLIGISFSGIFAETANRMTAKDLMNMTNDEAFPLIGKLSKEDVQILITQIKQDARSQYKEIDKFYLLISHLESIKAIEEEQQRLNSLHLVYICALVLFGGFLVYLLIAQRKIISQINSKI